MLFYILLILTIYLWGLIGTYTVIKTLFDQNKMRNFFIVAFWPVTMIHNLINLVCGNFINFIKQKFKKPTNPFQSEIIERKQPGRLVNKLEWDIKKNKDHLLVSLKLFVKEFGIIVEYVNGIVVNNEEDIYQAIRILHDYVSKKTGDTALTQIDTLYLNTEDMLNREQCKYIAQREGDYI